MSRGQIARELNTLINTAVTLVAIFLALKAFRGVTSAVDTALAPVAQKWFDLTHGPGVQVLGRVALPDGRLIAIQDILDAGGNVDAKGFFRWQGTTYQITGRNSSGDFAASRIIT